MNMTAVQSLEKNDRFRRMGLLAEPAGYVDGTNLYEYVRSNPQRRVDPLGTDDLDNQIDEEDAADGVFNDPILSGVHQRIVALNRWRGEQVKRLEAAFSALCPQTSFSRPGCVCSPEDCKAQAKELAQAIVNAVAEQVRKFDQPGGVAGNLIPGTFGCGDWQVLVATAVNKVVSKNDLNKNGCFDFVQLSASGKLQHGVINHQWVEISIGGGSTVVIDPWPSGGKGNLDDSSCTTGWPNVVTTPAWTPTTRPVTPLAPGSTTNPTSGPTTMPTTR